MSRFAEPDTAIEYARSRWEEGETRIRRVAADSDRRDILEEVVEGIMRELEKRIGQIFETMDLADIQYPSETWCRAIAHEVAPESPWAWEMDTVQNAAFHRYSRRASDYQMSTAL